MTYIVIGVLLALGAFMAYSAKTETGWDWPKGLAALVALGGAVYAWVSGLFHSVPPV
jgi:hypothetical protein